MWLRQKGGQMSDILASGGGVELWPRGTDSFRLTLYFFMAFMATFAREGFAPGNMPITTNTNYYHGLQTSVHQRCWAERVVIVVVQRVHQGESSAGSSNQVLMTQGHQHSITPLGDTYICDGAITATAFKQKNKLAEDSVVV